MRNLLMFTLVSMLGLHPQDASAQVKPQQVKRTAAIEARLLRDSVGCPTAIDLWLNSTTDTIQGFEVVLQWDRPNSIHFVRGVATAAKPVTATDSLTALLKPTDPRTQIPIDRGNSLTAAWEFVEARSVDGLSAKILGVVKLFGQDEPTPVLPGATGSLMRIPFSVLKAVPGADGSAVVLNFDAVNTRLSTPGGVLFGPLTLNSLSVNPEKCEKATAR